jgi:RNA polymerase sigma-70 factor (ECF subfamily)
MAASKHALPYIEALYTDHHTWLKSWLHRRLGCSQRAADLAHDTYLRILVSGRAPGPGQARPYLMQIAKGLVVDQHRRRVVEAAYLESIAHLPEAQAPSPETGALVIETLLEIDAILDRLPAKVRQAFLLSQIDGLAYAEIAHRLGVTISSVQKYMCKALQACYQALYE